MLGPDCSGRQVYDEISPAVCGVLQGQYVCVMAYGQTGAGKTFTMQGGGATQPGVVQLAAEELFHEAGLLQAAKRQQGQSLTMRLEVTLVEIYNEKLIDLLAEPHAAAAAERGLEIRCGGDGTVSVPGLTHVGIDAATAPTHRKKRPRPVSSSFG